MTAHAMRNSENDRDFPEESPELLRWRADALLDEMMIGGVDSSAASPTRAAPSDSAPSTAHSAWPVGEATDSQAPTAPPNGSSLDSTQSQPSANDWGLHSSFRSSKSQGSPQAAPFGEISDNWTQQFDRERAKEDAAFRGPQSQASPSPYTGVNQNGHRSPDEQRLNQERASEAPSTQMAQPGLHQPEGADADSLQNQPDEPMLRPPSAVSAADRPQPYGTSFLGAPRQLDGPDYRPYTYHEKARSHGRPDGSGRVPEQPPADEAFTVQKESKPWSVVSGGPGDYLTSVPRHSDTPYSAPRTRYTYDPVLGPTAYQQQPARFADSMSVGTQARRRTNVWPRHSRFDIQALQQEMATMQEQIDLLVKRRLDISERAQHLLDKGRTILENDPDRSAEVTYYVQQVRTMVQRTGQRVQWSNVYRNRLFTYSTAWFALSTLILAGCILYGDLIRLWLNQFAPFALNTFLAQHSVAFLGTLASGTLGSALAALVNAWRHSQKEYGYFDRKYGLLGTVLPIIGLLVGLLLYVIFGAIFWLFDVDPVVNPVAGWVPAVLTFIFGASQETIYGTTE